MISIPSLPTFSHSPPPHFSLKKTLHQRTPLDLPGHPGAAAAIQPHAALERLDGRMSRRRTGGVWPNVVGGKRPGICCCLGCGGLHVLVL